MNVACPECGSVFRVDPKKIPSAGVRARCSVCGGIIAIGAAGAIDEEFAAPAARAVARATPAAGASRIPVPVTRRTPGAVPTFSADTALFRPPAARAPVPVSSVAQVVDAHELDAQGMVTASAVKATPVDMPLVAAATPSIRWAPVIATEEAATPAREVAPPEEAAIGGRMPGTVTRGGGEGIQAARAHEHVQDRVQAQLLAATGDAGEQGAAPAPPALWRDDSGREERQRIGAGDAGLSSSSVAMPVVEHAGHELPPPVEAPDRNSQADALVASPTPPVLSRVEVPSESVRPPVGEPTVPTPAAAAPIATPETFPTPPAPAVQAPPTPRVAVPPAAPAAPRARAPINPFLANDPNQKAKRLARALVSDIVTYFPDKHREGVRDGTLRELFREEIKRSYEEYGDQMGKDFAESTTHFQDALNDVLAGGTRLF